MKPNTAISSKGLRRAMCKNGYMSAQQAEIALAAVIVVVQQLVLQGHTVILPGLATFYRRYRAARDNNLLNGKKKFIPAHWVLRIRPSRRLRDQCRVAQPKEGAAP